MLTTFKIEIRRIWACTFATIAFVKPDAMVAKSTSIILFDKAKSNLMISEISR